MGVLRVIFPPSGFFIADTRMALAVNGYTMFETSFKGGFDWWADMPPGWHVVETTIGGDLGFVRKKTYRFEVRRDLVTIAVLEHSRTWGNMTNTPKSLTFAPR